MIADQVNTTPVLRNAEGMILHPRTSANIAQNQDLGRDVGWARRLSIRMARGKKPYRCDKNKSHGSDEDRQRIHIDRCPPAHELLRPSITRSEQLSS